MLVKKKKKINPYFPCAISNSSNHLLLSTSCLCMIDPFFLP